MAMDWKKLLNPTRIRPLCGGGNSLKSLADPRSEFDRDYTAQTGLLPCSEWVEAIKGSMFVFFLESSAMRYRRSGGCSGPFKALMWYPSARRRFGRQLNRPFD